MRPSDILGFSSSPSRLTSPMLVLFVDEFSRHVGNGYTGPVLDSLGLTSNRKEKTHFFSPVVPAQVEGFVSSSLNPAQ